MSERDAKIRDLRAAIEQAETFERQLVASEAELEHAGRRFGDQLESLGGRDPGIERQLREMRQILALNAEENRRLRERLAALRQELTAAERTGNAANDG